MIGRLELQCPSCGRTNDGHDGPTPESQPSDGDVSICWRCHALSLYVDGPFGLRLRKPTDAEAEELANDPRIRDALHLVAESPTPADAASLRWGNR